jgi:hypothetical protein
MIETENPNAGKAPLSSHSAPMETSQPLIHSVFRGPVGNVAQNGHDFRQTASDGRVGVVNETGKDKRAGVGIEAKIAIATLVVAMLGAIAAWLAVPGLLK